MCFFAQRPISGCFYFATEKINITLSQLHLLMLFIGKLVVITTFLCKRFLGQIKLFYTGTRSGKSNFTSSHQTKVDIRNIAGGAD